jgi:phospholipase/carboxylesterase
MILSETEVQGHSCLVLDPPIIPPAAPVMVVLHGLGTNGDDLVPFCEQLRIPPCRFVLPDAPLHLPGYPEGAFAWYDFQAQDRAQIEKSRDYLFRVLGRFSEDPNLRPAPGTAKKRTTLLLAGFSQGGVMALEAGLNYPGPVAAVVSMSGYMPDPWATLTRAQAPFGTPILLVHGTRDEVVPPEGSRAAGRALREAGYAPVLREFPMAHTMTAESLEEVGRFLGQIPALKS